jgi:hypothetical protein
MCHLSTCQLPWPHTVLVVIGISRIAISRSPLHLFMEPSMSQTPIWGDTCSPLNCYDCGVVAFRSFMTTLVLILTSLEIPIYRSPMHVRAYSSTSPLPRHPIGYRKIVIPDATISLSSETLILRSPTPQDLWTRVPTDGWSGSCRDIWDRDFELPLYPAFENPDRLNFDSSGSPNTRPPQRTVLILSGYCGSRFQTARFLHFWNSR